MVYDSGMHQGGILPDTPEAPCKQSLDTISTEQTVWGHEEEWYNSVHNLYIHLQEAIARNSTMQSCKKRDFSILVG